ncbi:MAG: hypothetical protein P0121_02950 [Nitrospira sp.]|nr:hypothetical protein [Nitrospira sp.]
MITLSIKKAWNKGAAYAVAFGIVTMVGLAPGTTCADQQPPMLTVGYQSGMITSIYETTFQIDHRTYSLTPDAVLLDRHGDELNASYLRMDIEVKFHLQKDSKDKIDRMILFLPE